MVELLDSSRKSMNLRTKIRELELLRADRGKAIFDAGAICVKAGSGAALAYAAIVGLVAPEPTVTKVVGAVAAVGAGIACVGSIYSAWRVEGVKQENKIEEITEAGVAAATEFQDLQQTPP